MLAAGLSLLAVACGSSANKSSSGAASTANSSTIAPTTAPALTASPTPAAPKPVLSFSGSSDKTSISFTVGKTWQVNWTVQASTTPTVEVDDESGTTIDHLNTGHSGNGSTIEHQSCTCHVKVSVHGNTTYSFMAADLPGGAPSVVVPVLFNGYSDKATSNFTISSPWTLSWTIQANTAPTVEVFDESNTSVGRVDTGTAGSGSTVEHRACTCYLKVSVYGDTTYSFTIKPGG
jgi:hypothetical protein